MPFQVLKNEVRGQAVARFVPVRVPQDIEFRGLAGLLKRRQQIQAMDAVLLTKT